MRKLKVIGIPWHTSHQHMLGQLPFFEEYDLMLNPYRYFSIEQRPMPKVMKYVSHYRPGYYDLAILHIDQQSIYDPEHGFRISKGRAYAELNETIKDIPKVVINHMTPFHDTLPSNEVIDYVKQMVGSNFMVVNSYEAQKQWGWGYTIIHGLKPEDWPDLPKEPRCVVALSQAGMEKAYRRIFLHSVRKYCKDMGVPFFWIGVDVPSKGWNEYPEYLGRSLVYFNPTWQSPRPRARTEAMFCGCCVVTTPYQDADTYIEHGVNGFLTNRAKITDPRIMDDPKYTADLIKKLVIDEPDLALKIGQEGKKTAVKLFHFDNFVAQWEKFLKEVVKVL